MRQHRKSSFAREARSWEWGTRRGGCFSPCLPNRVVIADGRERFHVATIPPMGHCGRLSAFERALSAGVEEAELRGKKRLAVFVGGLLAATVEDGAATVFRDVVLALALA